MNLIRRGVTLLIFVAAAFAVATHQTFEVRLSTDVMFNEAMANRAISLGQVRVYDRKGRQVAELGGTSDGSFRNALNAVLRAPTPVESGKTLAWELSRLEDLKGHQLKKLPETDFTIVKYWDASCEPCQPQDEHMSMLLQSILEPYQKLRINFLHVDANMKARAEELSKKKASH